MVEKVVVETSGVLEVVDVAVVVVVFSEGDGFAVLKRVVETELVWVCESVEVERVVGKLIVTFSISIVVVGKLIVVEVLVGKLIEVETVVVVSITLVVVSKALPLQQLVKRRKPKKNLSDIFRSFQVHS